MKKQKKQSHEHKKIVVAIFSIVALLIIVLALLIRSSIYSVKIKINIAPSDANIIIGEKKYENGTISVKPGIYSVEVRRDGFEEYIDEITAEAGNTYYVYKCLKETDVSGGFYISRPEEQRICFVAQEHLLAEADKKRNRDPIFQITPYHSYDYGYKIDPYFEKETDEVVVKITALSCDSDKRSRIYQMAIDYLEKNGIDIKNYRIEKRNGCS